MPIKPPSSNTPPMITTNNKVSDQKGRVKSIAGQQTPGLRAPGAQPLDTKSLKDRHAKAVLSEASIQPESTRVQFEQWNKARKLSPEKHDGLVGQLFDGPYPATRQEAQEKLAELLDKGSSSPLRQLCNALIENWKKTVEEYQPGVYQMDEKTLEKGFKEKLEKAWDRMSDKTVEGVRNTYKLQMLAEALCLQPAGGHHKSPALKAFMDTFDDATGKYPAITAFRDGKIYDGDNAVSAKSPVDAITRSRRAVVAIESAFEAKEPGVVRNPDARARPDISLSNLPEENGIQLEELRNTDGEIMGDSVAFSNSVFAFHGPSVVMEERDTSIVKQLQTIDPKTKKISPSQFGKRIESYFNHNKAHGRAVEDIEIVGDANLFLFKDSHGGDRVLQPGAQNLLNKYKLALIVPSGEITWGRPVSDQLHKNATASALEGHRDSMLILVPVKSLEHRKALVSMCGKKALKQDLFLPRKALDGTTVVGKLCHRLPSPSPQFCTKPENRTVTDHKVLVGSKTIVGNTADCYGVGTKDKSLKYNKAMTVWGENLPGTELYQKLMGNTADTLSGFVKKRTEAPAG